MVSLEDLELVHFERVQFQLKNFDMVFIFKDYNRKVVIVGSIPMNMLGMISNFFLNDKVLLVLFIFNLQIMSKTG